MGYWKWLLKSPIKRIKRIKLSELNLFLNFFGFLVFVSILWFGALLMLDETKNYIANSTIDLTEVVISLICITIGFIGSTYFYYREFVEGYDEESNTSSET